MHNIQSRNHNVALCFRVPDTNNCVFTITPETFTKHYGLGVASLFSGDSLQINMPDMWLTPARPASILPAAFMELFKKTRLKHIASIACFLLAFNNANAQHTFLFKGQVYHNKLGAQKNLSILINNQYPAVTNDAGIFQVGLPNETTHIIVSLKKPAYAILYPTGGYVLIPKDLNEAPQIIIGNLEDDKQLKKYLSLYKQTKSTSSSVELQQLKRQMDSLQSILLQLHYSESELNNAREMQEKRDDYFPEISTTLTDYHTAATDLKTAFKYLSDYAFEKGAALEQLSSAIRNYNATFQKLNGQHANYEKRIGDYWQSDSLKADFARLAGLALDTIHLQKIYPMQETIGEIRKYFNAGVKDPELKKIIQQNIGNMVSELELLLPRLTGESNNLIRELNI